MFLRIVDEINQRMDADNGRKLINVIVDSVCSSQKMSQYVFVTPKLLFDWEYKRNMKVLLVYNGTRCNVNSDKWKISKFNSRQRLVAGEQQQPSGTGTRDMDGDAAGMFFVHNYLMCLLLLISLHLKSEFSFYMLPSISIRGYVPG